MLSQYYNHSILLLSQDCVYIINVHVLPHTIFQSRYKGLHRPYSPMVSYTILIALC